MRYALAVLVVAILAASPAAGQGTNAAGGEALHNVALTTLGATAKGSGVNFNKDWLPIRALAPGMRGGTIFNPFEGARIDIRLVVPVDIKAIEFVGLDYHGTRQVAGVEIYIDGKRVDQGDTVEGGELHDSKLGEVGSLAMELGVEGIRVGVGQLVD